VVRLPTEAGARLLLLEEQQAALSATDFTPDGLTRREAEVLAPTNQLIAGLPAFGASADGLPQARARALVVDSSYWYLRALQGFLCYDRYCCGIGSHARRLRDPP